ncbi:hypothetical protein [Thalassovita aquimarina]|uniref:Uncharacterized protein n=1 Tax=Thalassovita aquimarina TaxID=2785917 RepID=A0ABS5HM96_9RHOB|nr:hypothetical protein [Thalassovita aquimarina]MBR9650061.1 hypothetical protein [Thalassovita aquimarina]
MQIAFLPIRHDERLSISRTGDILTLNGEEFDFSAVPEGGALPREAVGCDWLASDVERASGALRLTLLLPHGAQTPSETLFPALLILERDGPVDLPPYEIDR